MLIHIVLFMLWTFLNESQLLNRCSTHISNQKPEFTRSGRKCELIFLDFGIKNDDFEKFYPFLISSLHRLQKLFFIIFNCFSIVFNYNLCSIYLLCLTFIVIFFNYKWVFFFKWILIYISIISALFQNWYICSNGKTN